ncbi:M28 family peptidase [Nakamurella sp. GG22]
MPPVRSRIPGLVLLLLLAVLGYLTVLAVSPPGVVAQDAPADRFSAERAYRHVEQIGGQVHPAGSEAAGTVRDHIASALTDLGLHPEIHQAVGGTGALSGPYGMARVNNVVAVLPGSAPTGRVVLFAHYDSVQVSFGGNDDGAGVGTLLETARAMQAGPPPVNDVVFLFTDAEEACLCGAEAFVSSHPLAAEGGVALNFEARGSTGPAVMFETSLGNAAVVDLYGGVVPYPVATSFAVEVYRILPNDTDFTPFRESGRFAGLNTAYIDGSAVYHSPQDTPASMDRRSLQQHGDNAVALARAFGDADIPAVAAPGGADLTYFPALGVLIRYPGWLVWPLAVLALAGVTAVAYLARRAASWPRLAAGFGLAVIPLVLAPVAAQGLWALLVAIRPEYGNMIDPWNPGWFRACVIALVATIVLAWYGLLRRRIGSWPLAIGALGWLAVIGVALAALTPGGSYLATIPALAGAAGTAVALTVRQRWAGLTAVGLAGAVAVIVLVPTVYLFFPALGLATGAAGALFAVMLALALLPVLDLLYPTTVEDGVGTGPSKVAAAMPAIVAGALVPVCLVAGLLSDGFDAEHPAPAHLAYALDTDTGTARWISTDADPGDWLSQYVTGREDLNDPFGLFADGVLTGPAPAADLPPPEVRVNSDSTANDRRTITFTVTPRRPVRLVYADLPGATVLSATVDGRQVPMEGRDGEFGVVFHAPPPGGVRFVVEVDSTGPTPIRVMDGSDGLDGLPGFRPRPHGVGIDGSHTSELVVVAATVRV